MRTHEVQAQRGTYACTLPTHNVRAAMSCRCQVQYVHAVLWRCSVGVLNMQQKDTHDVHQEESR